MSRHACAVLAALVAMLFAACGPSSPQAGQQPTISGTGTAGGATKSRTPAASPSWTPAPADKRPADLFTVAEYQRSLVWNVKNPPPVPVKELVRPSKLCPKYAQCMKEMGQRPTPCEGERGVGFTTDDDSQLEAAYLAHYVCQAQYPPPPEFYRPYSKAILRRMYDWTLATVVPCLEQEGHDVGEIISFDTFESRYRIDRSVWNPITLVGDTSCPASYPDEVISPQ